MALCPVFHGRVTPDARLELADQERSLRRTYLQSLRGQAVDVIVRKHREQRSLDQNKYLHAVPFALLADYWGEDIETTKLLVLGEKFGWKDTRYGRVPIKPSTAALSVEETTDLIDWLPPWGLTNFGVVIPYPNEAVNA